MKKNNLQFKLLRNYIFLFFIISIIGILTTTFIIYIGEVFHNNSIKNKFKAKTIIKDNYNNIKAKSLIDYGGGFEVIDKNYNILLNKGKNVHKSEKLSSKEFADFFSKINKPDDNLEYDFFYNDKKDFWLVINYPIDFELRMYLNRSTNISDFQNNRIRLFIFTSLSIYMLLFFLGLYIYSKITVKSFVRPLNELIDKFKNVIYKKEYNETEIDGPLEFIQLNNIFNKMLLEIKDEKKQRNKIENNRKKLILDISHDLKNPLANILGYSDMLKNDQLKKEESKKYAEIINKNAIKSNKLLNDLFDYSKYDRDEFKMDFKLIDFTEFIKRYFIEYIDILDSKGFKYEFNLKDKKIKAKIDIKLFKRALDNLIDNAIKYNSKGTKIYIELRKVNEKIELIIKDNGKGIDKSIKKDIFKPFSKIKSSKNSSGLGLAITKKIISKHNGEISLVDNSSKGACFKISLKYLR